MTQRNSQANNTKNATRNEPHLFATIEDAAEFFLYGEHNEHNIDIHIGSGNYDESFEDGEKWVQKLFPGVPPGVKVQASEPSDTVGTTQIRVTKFTLLNNLKHIASVLHDSNVFIEAEDADLDLSIILCSSKDHPAGLELDKIKATDIRLWTNMANRKLAQKERKSAERHKKAQAVKAAKRTARAQLSR